jgi:iron complex transport system ATP-binding protein
MRVTVDDVTAVIDHQPIVSSASIELGDGEVVGLVGPNGSGKSTLLRCIYRALRPHGGAIELDGENVWTMPARVSAQRTAVLVQEPPTEFDFAVRDIVVMGRTPHLGLLDRPSEDDDRLVDAALARVHASALAHRSFVSLSGGEKQRVLLARALAQQPRLLILDEPTNHLDICHQLEVLELVRELKTTALAALHDLNLAAAYCDRLYVLSQGAIVAEGLPRDVLTSELLEAVFRVGAERSEHPVNGAPQLTFYPLAHAPRAVR